jgi:ribose 5-phosphate isomerase B
MIFKKIVIASDHAGFKLKQEIIKYIHSKGVQIKDLGTYTADSVDYPDFAHTLAYAVENKEFPVGISICGSGNGINMTVNKHAGIRSALCWQEEIARLARFHNDANICALPGRFLDKETAIRIVDIFLSTEFEGGRHQRRIDKIPIKKQ